MKLCNGKAGRVTMINFENRLPMPTGTISVLVGRTMALAAN